MQSATATLRGLVLALDFGERRIGCAIADARSQSARALPTLTGGLPDVLRCLREWGPSAVAIGLPLNDDGSDQAITQKARQFQRQLAAQCKLPMYWVDERYTSREADTALRAARANGELGRRLKKGDRDGQAARILLEQFLAEPTTPITATSS